MEFGKVITKGDIRYYEVADQVFAAISLNKGLSWANAGFITSGKGMVYDTFVDLPHARNMKKTFVELKGCEPAYVVNSHHNCDHVWGNQVFSGSTIIMHKNAPIDRIPEDPVMWRDIVENGMNGGPGTQYIANEMGDFDLRGIEWQDPDILIENDTTIMLGSMEVQILSVAPSHSNSDLLLWLPKERVVYCGDIVFERGGAIAYSAQGIKLWIKALDFIINELNPNIVVPGHGALCDIEEVKLNKEYFEFVLEQVDAHYTDDISSMELSKKIDVDQYKHFLQPERLFINVNALVNERRGKPNLPDWNFFAEQMQILKKYHDERYGVRPWNPQCSWKD